MSRRKRKDDVNPSTLPLLGCSPTSPELFFRTLFLPQTRSLPNLELTVQNQVAYKGVLRPRLGVGGGGREYFEDLLVPRPDSDAILLRSMVSQILFSSQSLPGDFVRIHKFTFRKNSLNACVNKKSHGRNF